MSAPTIEAASRAGYSRADLLAAYQRMSEIRAFEDRLHTENLTGDIPGFIHLYAGEEAIAVGVCDNLRRSDYIASTHRGHGHCLAKGCGIRPMMCEIFGKEEGLCHGKGGSMHIADLSTGMLGANGIVGGGPPLVCGVGLSAKIRGTSQVGVAFTGDGGANQGTFLESLNLAAVWDLPVVFVVENNGYAESTSSQYHQSGIDVAKRADGFGLPGVVVDGHDFFAVREAAGAAIERARSGGGPSLVECKTDRFYGHFEGDQQKYRAADEVERLRAEKDCLKRFEQAVTEGGQLASDDLRAVDAQVADLIDRAVDAARNAPPPAVEDLLTDVYVTY